MRKGSSVRWMISALFAGVLACVVEGREAGTTKWIKIDGTAGDWDEPSNWDNGVPQEGDDVFVGHTAKIFITLNHSTPLLNSLVMKNARPKPSASYQQQITCSGWNTCVRAKTLTLDIGGVITHAGPYATEAAANRVWIQAETLMVMEGGSILADAVGYKQDCGPAWASGVRSHSSITPIHAGIYVGGKGHGEPYFEAYGDPVEPSLPGSGGTAANSSSGGAIRLEVTGLLTVDGLISASSAKAVTASASPGASIGGTGGAVWITCDRINGSGTVQANAKHCSVVGALQSNYAAGAGRVAVHYNPVSQAAVTDCTVRFEALASVYRNNVDLYSGIYGSASGQRAADSVDCPWAEEGFELQGRGSLYFTDDTFLKAESYRVVGWKFGGELITGSPIGNLVFDGPITFDKCQLVVREPGLKVTANAGLNAFGTGYYARREMGVVFSNADVTVNGPLTLAGSRFGVQDGTLTVNGDVTLTNADFATSTAYLGGELVAFAGPTNAPSAYGAEVTVNGDCHVGPGGVIHVECEPVNGAVVKLAVNGSMTVDEGGRVDSDMGGYLAGPGSANNYSPGPSYGGHGAGAAPKNIIPTYGNEKDPVDPGSGGGFVYSRSTFSRGGGTVLLTVAKTLTLNGLISADSHRKWGGRYLAPGSGGSVNVRTMGLTGTGRFSASGGVSDYFGYEGKLSSGAGGRIAVRVNPMNCDWTDEMKAARTEVLPGPRVATNAAGNAPDYTIPFPDPVIADSEPGTVYWGRYGSGLMLLLR